MPITKKSSNKGKKKDEPSYEGIPSVYVPYNQDNQWWKRREESLQAIASYTCYSKPFR